VSLAARWRALAPEQRLAAVAAAALAASLILPWYEKSYIPEGTRSFVQDNLSAFGVFSFVEAAVLLVAAGVIYLLWARAERKAFHLPFGDGGVITAAGGWALLLLVWRLFDKPDIDDPGATVGIQWGIFGAMLAAGGLAAAGQRLRAAHTPEPPNPVADEPVEPSPRRERVRTEVLGGAPAWEGDVPTAPTERPADAPPSVEEAEDGAPERQDRLF